MSKYYTGVGSRKTPPEILKMMTGIAMILNTKDWILRSGHAFGADRAFEDGVDKTYLKEIYLADDATEEAMNIAKNFHPAWDRCSNYAKKLHARNCFQVLGRDLSTPSKFLLCWTPDGCISRSTRTRNTGGTGTAIAIADYYDIPIFNLQNKNHFERLIKFLK